MSSVSATSESGRVWVISELFYPELTSTGYFVTAIAEGLAGRYDVSALCGQPNYSARGTRALKQENRNGVTIHRAAGTVLDKNILLFRLVNVITLSISLFWQACRRLRPGDTAIVVTNPPLLPFLVAVACKLTGARCVLLIHDVYPNVLVAAGMVRENHWMVGLLERAVRWLYQHADHVIAIGRDMARLAESKMSGGSNGSGHAARLSIIPNWGEVEEIQPLDKAGNTLLERLGLSGKFVVQYAGNMGRSHDLESLVECARVLRGDERFHFLLIGTGAKRAWLDRQAEVLPNLTVLDPLPRADRDLVLSACDISVIPFVPGMFGVSVPSRMYNVMASGRPLVALCDRGSEVAAVIREERIGWVLDPGDIGGLADALRVSAEAPMLLSEMGARARAAVERKYTSAHVIRRYESVIRELKAA